jgi:hypothetical protein
MLVEEGKVVVTMSASGVDPVSREGELATFTIGERLVRAGVVMFAAIMLAAALIPIPIVHLVGIPLVLLIGIMLSVRQFRSVARLAPMRMPCPKCDAENLLGGGLGYRTVTGPIVRNCESCRRSMSVSFKGVP